MSVGGSTGWVPNSSRARANMTRTSSSCCCSTESAMSRPYRGKLDRTIHSPRLRFAQALSGPRSA